MKRILTVFLSVILVLSTFVGCAASQSSVYDNGDKYSPAAEAANDYYYDDYAESETAESEELSTGSGLDGAQVTTESADLSAKIIYSASIQMESLEFDECISKIPALLNSYNAFLESSSIDGVDYESTWNNWSTYRTAHYTIRVPKDNFDTMVNSFTDLGNVTYSTVYSDNITSQYHDVESRLNAYRTEESQLLEILSSCETVEDMITVQSRLSDVRYQIESITSQLRDWDNSVNYSTINLSISEVKKLTDPVEEKTYWEDLWDSFVSVLEWLGNFFSDLFIVLVASLPIFVVLGIITAIVLLIIFKSKKRRKKKLAGKEKIVENQEAEGKSNKEAEKEAAAPIVSDK